MIFLNSAFSREHFHKVFRLIWISQLTLPNKPLWQQMLLDRRMKFIAAVLKFNLLTASVIFLCITYHILGWGQSWEIFPFLHFSSYCSRITLASPVPTVRDQVGSGCAKYFTSDDSFWVQVFGVSIRTPRSDTVYWTKPMHHHFR